jgi:thioesterase domain-containing protein
VDAQGVVRHAEMSEMVSHYIEKIRLVQPHGPYILAGLCVGGNIAFEIGRRLQHDGETVAMVALFDAADVGASRIKGLRLSGGSTGSPSCSRTRRARWG